MIRTLPLFALLGTLAGSGALGLEALSRGATAATFVESGAPALRVLRANLALLGADDRATVVRTDAMKYVAGLAIGAFDIAFADPPYGQELAADLVRIFLAHQPKTLHQTASVPFDLMLSDHTHGGQFFPWNLATAMDQPYLSGLHRPNGKWVYVSKGTGYWGPPVRLGARSEITVVTLVPERA